ncbi:Nucleoporin [Carpediemonas membranifera]|uniref:Nucleoporin n=1 Tax=Carpediemonas membranifera TaxID=201153 RepID=A0A8J6ASC4_9EUKA|nr:Nucleoporin [Carpediemonas membranifera]|eukprot:KAG9392818.1 Nucleoporin [Carpediemonas membranifera]
MVSFRELNIAEFSGKPTCVLVSNTYGILFVALENELLWTNTKKFHEFADSEDGDGKYPFHSIYTIAKFLVDGGKCIYYISNGHIMRRHINDDMSTEITGPTPAAEVTGMFFHRPSGSLLVGLASGVLMRYSETMAELGSLSLPSPVAFSAADGSTDDTVYIAGSGLAVHVLSLQTMTLEAMPVGSDVAKLGGSDTKKADSVLTGIGEAGRAVLVLSNRARAAMGGVESPLAVPVGPDGLQSVGEEAIGSSSVRDDSGPTALCIAGGAGLCAIGCSDADDITVVDGTGRAVSYDDVPFLTDDDTVSGIALDCTGFVDPDSGPAPLILVAGSSGCLLPFAVVDMEDGWVVKPAALPPARPAEKTDDKPAAAPMPGGFGSDLSAFGVKKTDDKPASGFGFGAKPAEKTDDKPAAAPMPGGFGSDLSAFGVKKTDDKPASGFGFGAKPAEKTDDKPAAAPMPGGFGSDLSAFGVKKTDDKPASGFGFGAKPATPGFSAKPAEKTDDKPAAAPMPGGFGSDLSAFGVKKTDDKPAAAPMPGGFGSDLSAFGVKKTDDKPASGFGFGAQPAEKTDDKPAAAPMPGGFGSDLSAFGVKKTDDKPASGFGFGAKPATPGFSAKPAEKTDDKPASGFGFGAQPAEKTDDKPAAAPMPGGFGSDLSAFGVKKTDDKPASGFGFGAKPATPGFSAKPAEKTDDKPAAAPMPGGFGSDLSAFGVKKTDDKPASGFGFGAKLATPGFSAKPAEKTDDKPASGFGFGAKPATPGFSAKPAEKTDDKPAASEKLGQSALADEEPMTAAAVASLMLTEVDAEFEALRELCNGNYKALRIDPAFETGKVALTCDVVFESVGIVAKAIAALETKLAMSKDASATIARTLGLGGSVAPRAVGLSRRRHVTRRGPTPAGVERVRDLNRRRLKAAASPRVVEFDDDMVQETLHLHTAAIAALGADLDTILGRLSMEPTPDPVEALDASMSVMDIMAMSAKVSRDTDRRPRSRVTLDCRPLQRFRESPSRIVEQLHDRERAPIPVDAKPAEKTDDKPASGFGFGAKPATPGFSAKPAEKTDDKPASGFSFGAKPAEKTDDKPAAAPMPGGFGSDLSAFGVKKTDDKPASGFGFGAKPATPGFSAKPAEKTDDKPAAAPMPGGFGSDLSAFGVKKTDDKPASGFGFGAKPATPGFSAKPAEKTDDKPASGFGFGAKPATPGFSAKPAEKTDDKPAAAPMPGGFGSDLSAFGVKKTDDKPASGFGFGAKPATPGFGATPAAGVGAKPAIGFGAQQSQSGFQPQAGAGVSPANPFGAPPAAPANPFGQSPSQAGSQQKEPQAPVGFGMGGFWGQKPNAANPFGGGVKGRVGGIGAAFGGSGKAFGGM